MGAVRVIILIVAILSAGLAAFLTLSIMSQSDTAPVVEVQAAVSESRILVAAADLHRGDRLAPASMAWRAWPGDAVADGFITEQSAASALEDRVGAIATGFILAGEPIVDAKIVKEGDGRFLSALLTPGMRAVSVEISEETAAAGFILPGDRVDVILTRRQESADGSRADEYRSETVLKDLKVLAVDQKVNQDDDQETIVGGTATLEASLAQAEALKLAQAKGQVSLVLRSLAQPQGAQTDITDFDLTASPRLKIVRYGQVSQTSGAR